MTAAFEQPPRIPVPNDRLDRQRLVSWWAVQAFGEAEARDIRQRGVRLLEEAIELFQSVGGTSEMAIDLVEFVFKRPRGVAFQELGGVAVCAMALAEALHSDLEFAERAEIVRILQKPVAHFTARNKAKNEAGFLAVAGTP